MRNLLLPLLVHLLLCPLSIYPQEGISSDVGNMLIEILGEENENLAEAEEVYEYLMEIYLRKENINLVSKEVLNKIPFLTEFQVFSFLEYRKKYGIIYSSNELYLITGFHDELIKKMQLLFSFQAHQVLTDSIVKRKPKITQKLLIRTKIEYPGRAGFVDDSDSSEYFRGSPFYRLLKYEIHRKERFRLGLTMECDAGEVFEWNKNSKGFNFHSFYGELNNPGILKKVIIGDYKINAAEGLIFNSGRVGKTSANAFQRKIPEIKKYSSTGEYGFYRGAVFHAAYRGFSVVNFYSWVKNSGNVYQNNDSTFYFRSLYTVGLFRNQKEIRKRYSITERAAGLILSYTTDHFQAGYNLKISGYSPKIEYPEMGDPYSGNSQNSSLYWQSLFYNFQMKRIFLSGEMAFKKDGGTAYQQKISLFVHPLLTMNFAYRNFSQKYYCPGTSGFSESGNTRNEHGFYTGFIAYPFSFLKLRAYIDQYSYPWIDYRSSFPLKGTDLYLDTDWYISKSLDLRIYFKMENKLARIINNDSPVSEMLNTCSYRFYGQFSWEISKTLSWRSRAEFKIYKTPFEKETGNLIYQEFNRSFPKISAKLNLRYSLFDIPDWQARIYVWEHDLLYSFNSPSYYKTGYNFFLNFRFKAREILNLGFKFSTTGYTSLREAGTDADYRSSRNFYEIKLQCILKI